MRFSYLTSSCLSLSSGGGQFHVNAPLNAVKGKKIEGKKMLLTGAWEVAPAKRRQDSRFGADNGLTRSFS
jgi:hypothetical protein